MTTYNVIATVSYIGWVTVEADSEDEALDIARESSPRDWEIDEGTAEADFNVTPAVEVA